MIPYIIDFLLHILCTNYAKLLYSAIIIETMINTNFYAFKTLSSSILLFFQSLLVSSIILVSSILHTLNVTKN